MGSVTEAGSDRRQEGATTMETMMNSQAADHPSLDLSGRAGDREVHLQTANPDVMEAISRFDDPSRGVAALIEVGAHAILAASTGFDISEVRREVDRVVTETSATVSGVRQQLLDAVGEEGPLARSLLAASQQLSKALAELVEEQSNPDVPGTLLAKLAVTASMFQQSLADARKELADDLAKTADKYADGLNKALREMRDLDPASGLGRAFSGIEKTLKSIEEAMATSAGARAERHRGTAKGDDYEEMVACEVASIAAVYGDSAERTGQQQGSLVKKERSFRGDVTCSVDGEVAIVLEAMDRGSARLTAKLVQDELLEATLNRGAKAAIAVVSSAENSLMCKQPIQFLGPSTWAVVLDGDRPDPTALQVAYRLARQVALAPARGGGGIDLVQVRAVVDDLNTLLGGLAEIRTQLTNIARSRETADAALVRVERELRNKVMELAGTIPGD